MEKRSAFSYLAVWIVLVVVVLLLAGLLIWKRQKATPAVTATNQTTAPTVNQTPTTVPDQIPATVTDQKFITANPLDLTQIKSISKFRSCAGHDFSGISYEGVVETDRSMKLYIYPIDKLAASKGKIKILSPITGTVDHYEPAHAGTGGANGTLRGDGIWIKVPDLPIDVVLAHVDPVMSVAEGTTFQAGQLVGYANLSGSAGNNFDLVIQGVDRQEKYYSIFKHMTPAVLAEYSARGITPDDMIVSKDFRDAHPCGYPGKNQEGNGTNTNYDLDFVTLK